LHAAARQNSICISGNVETVELYAPQDPSDGSKSPHRWKLLTVLGRQKFWSLQQGIVTSSVAKEKCAAENAHADQEQQRQFVLGRYGRASHELSFYFR